MATRPLLDPWSQIVLHIFNGQESKRSIIHHQNSITSHQTFQFHLHWWRAGLQAFESFHPLQNMTLKKQHYWFQNPAHKLLQTQKPMNSPLPPLKQQYKKMPWKNWTRYKKHVQSRNAEYQNTNRQDYSNLCKSWSIDFN